MIKQLYPENEEQIRKEIFHHWYDTKTLKESSKLTHHIYYNDDINGVGIIFGASMESDEECIKAAKKVFETTNIKRWCTTVSIYRILSPYSTDRIFEKEIKKEEL